MTPQEYIANQNGTVSSYLKDNHGNVIGKTDAAGTMMQAASALKGYDAYGSLRVGVAPDPFGYCGEYYDLESGMIYLRNRYYDSSQGRFITKDPAKDGLNWYGYCNGNPVMYVDPSGEIWITDRITDAWNAAKWAFNTVKEYANEAQKTAQRKFWETGSQLILRDKWGYETSAWMLEHSLQDNPSDIWRDNNSRIAYLINNDSGYLSELDKAIAKSKNNRLDNYKIYVQFNDGDLYYSIHRRTIY